MLLPRYERRLMLANWGLHATGVAAVCLIGLIGWFVANLFNRQIASYETHADLARMFWRQLTVRGSSIGTLDEFREMCVFLVQTGVKPLVDSEFALSDAHAAFTRLHEGSEFGKIVVIPST